MEDRLFCSGGGCTAKLGPGILERILGQIPRGENNPNLLVGYDKSDDAAVYRISDDAAIVQTLDFFPPMIDDPYIFGQIAATNALSDIYAMGGRVLTALNIVCYPEKMDLNILGKIMSGGAKKVIEAGGCLAGGHSIADDSVKYGLSVTGIVNPNRIFTNIGGKLGDVLLLTKKLGVGIICTANRVKMASEEAINRALDSMTTLNKYAAEVLTKYNIHGCTDVTGFGLLGHLHEMLDNTYSAIINRDMIPYFDEAYNYAEDFLITAAAQRNRNHIEKFVEYGGIPFPLEEILYDPQTSGGLLAAVDSKDADAIINECNEKHISVFRIGEITNKQDKEIIIR